MQKIFYWCPFISNVATVKAVINSCVGLNKYGNLLKPYIINCFGEFDEYNDEIIKNKIIIINLNNNRFIKKFPSQGFLFSRIKYIVIFFISFFALSKLIKKEKPAFFIAHLITSLPILLFKFNRYNTKLILRISGLPKLNFIRYYFWKICSNRISAITSPTEGTKKDLKDSNLFSNNKIFVLEDPILNMSDIFKNRRLVVDEPFLVNEKYILAIGRLTEQKNFRLLINYFNKIKNIDKKIKLVILGAGEQREYLINLIKKFGLNDRVYLLGHKDNVYKYLYRCTIFILTSKWEDPGFVLIEAAANRALILSSNCPNGPKEFLDDDKCGYLYKNNNIDDLIYKYNILINDNANIKKKKIFLALKKAKKFTVLSHTTKMTNILEAI
jgi:glycosyltransferase involved in cell wall biosynthesis